MINREQVPCDLCGCEKSSVLYEKPDFKAGVDDFNYPVVKCAGCGLVYVNPRPAQDSMGKFYVETYHQNRNTQYFQERYQKQISFLPKLSNERVLDVGCANGDFLIALKQRYPGIEAHGTDVYSKSVNSSQIHFHPCELSQINLPDGAFDIITAWAVFEHLLTPAIYFEKCRNLLKPGGKLVILVTNADSLFSRLAYREDIPRHTYHFSKRSLTRYSNKYNLNLERFVYDDSIYDGRGVGTFKYSLGRLWKLSLRQIKEFKPDNKIQKKALKFGSFLDKLIFKYHWEKRLGCSGIVIAEFVRPT